MEIRGSIVKKLIKEAATGLFAKKVYDASSMNEIAQNAGVGVSSGYPCFKIKEEPLHEAVMNIFMRSLTSLGQILRPVFLCEVYEPKQIPYAFFEAGILCFTKPSGQFDFWQRMLLFPLKSGKSA